MIDPGTGMIDPGTDMIDPSTYTPGHGPYSTPLGTPLEHAAVLHDSDVGYISGSQKCHGAQ